MFLYHGTNAVAAEKILQEGLKTRKEIGSPYGNWYEYIQYDEHEFVQHNVASHEDMVYMTNDLVKSEFYGCVSSLVSFVDEFAILKIDLDKLDKNNLRVDENYLDLIESGYYVNIPLQQRIKQRERAFEDKRWEESLKHVGGCAYVGTIPPEAISVLERKPLIYNKFYDRIMEDPKTPTERSLLIKLIASNAAINLSNYKQGDERFEWLHVIDSFKGIFEPFKSWRYDPAVKGLVIIK